jgi:hypothetical protein
MLGQLIADLAGQNTPAIAEHGRGDTFSNSDIEGKHEAIAQ